MGTVLTAAGVARLKSDLRKRVEIPDAILPGLYLVVQPSGVKTWAVRYRHRGRSRKLTIGRYPVFDVVKAREVAREALQAIAAGCDPAAEKRERQRPEPLDPGRDLVSAHVAAFMARHVRPSTKARTAAETERRFQKYVLPVWGARRVQDIGRRDVIELLDGIVDAGVPITANRTLTTLKTFFSWLVDRSVIDQSPCVRVKAPAPESSRDRVLSNDEIRLLWKAADRLGSPHGNFVQLLLLTAQRRDEVAGLKRSELPAPDLWTIPAERTKGGRAHDVPLSAAAKDIVENAPRIGSSAFVFTIEGDKPITGYSGAKRRLDALMAEIATEEARTAGREPPTIEPWTFHDIRRTAASGLARLGMPVNVIEAVLNHRGGEVSGVAAVYNRHSYLPEKRRALETWARYVADLVDGSPANIVPLRRDARDD
jgi:integrase